MRSGRVGRIRKSLMHGIKDNEDDCPVPYTSHLHHLHHYLHHFLHVLNSSFLSFHIAVKSILVIKPNNVIIKNPFCSNPIQTCLRRSQETPYKYTQYLFLPCPFPLERTWSTYSN